MDATNPPASGEGQATQLPERQGLMNKMLSCGKQKHDAVFPTVERGRIKTTSSTETEKRPMRKKLLATIFFLATASCGSDPPVGTQPEEGTCYDGNGKPCGTDGGAGTGNDSGGSGGNNDTGGTGGGSNKPPIGDGGAGGGGTGGKDSGGAGSGGGDTGGAGGSGGDSGTGGSGGDSGTGGSGGSGCPGLQVKCGGVCKDLAWDYSNCGSCGNTCSGGKTCQAGQCLPCPSGKWNCGTACVDFTSDEANCGGCNIKCDSGETCHALASPPWGNCY